MPEAFPSSVPLRGTASPQGEALGGSRRCSAPQSGADEVGSAPLQPAAKLPGIPITPSKQQKREGPAGKPACGLYRGGIVENRAKNQPTSSPMRRPISARPSSMVEAPVMIFSCSSFRIWSISLLWGCTGVSITMLV